MMSQRERFLQTMAVHVASRIALFLFLSWAVLYAFLRLDVLTVVVWGLASSACFLLAEFLIGISVVSSMLRPRWIERGKDVVLWSLVEGEAEKAGLSSWRVGILNHNAPNAIAISSFTGRPAIVLTRGLLVGLTYQQVRAVVAHLMGCSRSGFLFFLTALSGLVALSNRVAKGYIKKRLEGRPPGLVDIILAGWSYLYFALTYTQASMAGRAKSVYGDEFSILQTGDPTSLFCAILKVADSISNEPLDPMRKDYMPLKGLMFQDPASALRDASDVKEAADTYGIDLARLFGRYSEHEERDEPRLHIFERFWVQPGLADRLEHVVEFGGRAGSPLRLGLDLKG